MADQPAAQVSTPSACVRPLRRPVQPILDALDGLQEKSAKDVEKEQEAMLMAKYGGLKPKKKLLPKASQGNWLPSSTYARLFIADATPGKCWGRMGSSPVLAPACTSYTMTPPMS